MSTGLHVSFAQGVTPRQLKSRGSRLVAAKQRLVVKATAGNHLGISTANSHINNSWRSMSYITFVSVLWTISIAWPAETELAEELKSLEIMRKFSEQYAKRYVDFSIINAMVG